MALIDRSMHKLILRVQVRQEIDPLAWVSHAKQSFEYKLG
jgi:hypothetical protein